MMRHTLAALFAATMMSGMAVSAASAEGIIDEARFGGTWAQPVWLDGSHPESDQVGINGELLFTPFNWDSDPTRTSGFVHALLTPRFHLGGVANFDDDGTSYAYAGLTWQFRITERFFAEASFGGSVNNGSKEGSPNRAHLGSKVTFRESFALGYDIMPNLNVIVQLDHNSHAQLADDKNRGLSAAHVKFGYKF